MILIAMMSLAAMNANASTVERGTYFIQHVENGRYLDAYTHQDHDYKVVTRTSLSSSSQQWLIRPITGLENTYTLQQVENSRHLDAYPANVNDSRVVTRTAHNNNNSQQWILTAVPNERDVYTIQQVETSRYLDSHLDAISDFQVVTRTAQNNASQKWKLSIAIVDEPLLQAIGYIVENKNGGSLIVDTGTESMIRAGMKMTTGYWSSQELRSLREENRWIFTRTGLIRNALDSNLCLAVSAISEFTNATDVEVANCNGTVGQQWRYTAEGYLKNRLSSSSCLGITGAAGNPGHYPEVYLKHNCYVEDTWTIDKKAAIPAIKAIGHIKSGIADNKCLDSGWSTDNRSNVHLWDCADVNQQDWYFTYKGEIRSSRKSSMCLDVNYGSATNGTNVQLYQCNGTQAQKWIYNEGKIRTALNASHCLSLADGLSDNGTNAHIWECTDNKEPYQQWSLKQLPWAPITHGTSFDSCLTDSGGTASNGDSISISSCNNEINQSWMLTASGELRNAEAANRCLSYGKAFENNSWNSASSQECNGSLAQKWELTPSNQLKNLAEINQCLTSDLVLSTCNNSTSQKWYSRGFLNVNIQKIDGNLALVLARGDIGHAIINPQGILSTLAAMGADDFFLNEVHNRLSPEQLAVLPQDFSIAESINGNLGSMTVAGEVKLTGPGAAAEFTAEPGTIEAEAGVNLLTGEYGVLTAKADGPSAAAVITNNGESLQMNTGVSLIGAGATAGNEDASHAGISVSAGIGAEFGTKFGDGDQYGVTFGIKAITINLYVSGADAKTAYHETANWTTGAANDTADWSVGAVNDTGTWFEGAGSDILDWTTVAANDTAAWFEGAADDTVDWFETAGSDVINEVADIFTEIGDFFSGLF